jgi:hypothetical protein
MSTARLVASTTVHDYYIVRSAACMPNNCWGKYENVAIVRQARDAAPPKQIRDTARGAVVALRAKQFSGSSLRCAAERADDDLTARAERMAARERAALRAEACEYHRGEGC